MNENESAAKPRKKIVLDSSSLISISDNCFIKVMKHLAQKENISFIIPESVYMESVQTPARIKRFELNAIRIRDAVEEGYIKVMKTTPAMRQRMERLERETFDLCECDGEKVRLLHLGESETLALIKEINADVLAIDERTTRMLIEEPQNIVPFLQRRHEGRVSINRAALDSFRAEYGGIKIVRSVELIALSYDDGTFGEEIHRTRQALEAALYAVKFAGCAVSFNEIGNYLRKVGG